MDSTSHLSRSPFFNLDSTSALHVFSFLGPKDLCSAAMVCRDWKSTANDSSLWRYLSQSNPRPMLDPSVPLLLPMSPHQKTEYTAEKTGGHLTENRGLSFTPLLETQNFSNFSLTGISLGISDQCFPSTASGDLSDILPSFEQKSTTGGGYLAQCKEAYEVSEAWRKGHAKVIRLQVKGSDKASSVRIAPDGRTLVFASGGRGACHLFDLCKGNKYSELGLRGVQDRGEAAYDDLLGLYACSAISGDGKNVGFGGFDGVVRIYDVTSGRQTITMGGLQHRAAAQSLALSWDGSIIAAGLSDGHLALGRRVISPVTSQRTSQVFTRDQQQRESLYNCNSNTGGGNSTFGPGQKMEAFLHRPSSKIVESVDCDWWMVRHLGPGLAVTCVEANLGGEGEGPDRNLFVVGTSGGHVSVVDGETGDKKASLVGSCSCPITCLCIHSNRKDGPITSSECDRLVYGGFLHHNTGNGHSNAVYVWDLVSSERVALLYPGGGGGARQTRDRGVRGVGYLGTGGGGSTASGPIKSVFADGYKVATTSGKAVTIFESRTWKVLYEFTLSHQPLQQEHVEYDDVEGKNKQERDTDWFWNLAEGEGGGGGSHVTASGVESCISPNMGANRIDFPGFDVPHEVSHEVHYNSEDGNETGESSAGTSFHNCEISLGSFENSGRGSGSSSSQLEGNNVSGEFLSSEDKSDVRSEVTAFLSGSESALVSGLGEAGNSVSPFVPGSRRVPEDLEPKVGRIGSLGSEGDGFIFASRSRGLSEHPRVEAMKGKALLRSCSDGALQGGNGGNGGSGLKKPNSRMMTFDFYTDELAHQRVHFLGSQMVIPLRGGAVGVLAFGNLRTGQGTAKIDVVPHMKEKT